MKNAMLLIAVTLLLTLGAAAQMPITPLPPLPPPIQFPPSAPIPQPPPEAPQPAPALPQPIPAAPTPVPATPMPQGNITSSTTKLTANDGIDYGIKFFASSSYDVPVCLHATLNTDKSYNVVGSVADPITVQPGEQVYLGTYTRNVYTQSWYASVHFAWTIGETCE